MEYYELRDSVKKNGLHYPLLTRQGGQVVDGLKRREVLLDLGEESAPCLIKQMTDEQARNTQLQIEANRVPPTPVEYEARLRRLVKEEPQLTLFGLASKIPKHPDWVARALRLSKLNSNTRAALDRGDISLLSAMELAKLPGQMQGECLKDDPEVIRAKARHHRQSIKDDRVQYDNELLPEFRHRKEILRELENPTVTASVLCAEGIPLQGDVEALMKAFTAGVKWTVRSDALTLKQRQSKCQ